MVCDSVRIKKTITCSASTSRAVNSSGGKGSIAIFYTPVEEALSLVARVEAAGAPPCLHTEGGVGVPAAVDYRRHRLQDPLQ